MPTAILPCWWSHSCSASAHPIVIVIRASWCDGDTCGPQVTWTRTRLPISSATFQMSDTREVRFSLCQHWGHRHGFTGFVSYFYNFEAFPSVQLGYAYLHCRVVGIGDCMMGPQHSPWHMVGVVVLIASVEICVQLSLAQGNPGQTSEPSSIPDAGMTS